MPLRFSTAGRTAATAANARDVVAQLWNPSTDRVLLVREIRLTNTNAAAPHNRTVVARTTTTGTAGSTVTPDIDNEYSRFAAPPSGALLLLALFSVQPTVDATNLELAWYRQEPGAGFVWTYNVPVGVPPASGLAIINSGGFITTAADVTFAWDEL